MVGLPDLRLYVSSLAVKGEYAVYLEWLDILGEYPLFKYRAIFTVTFWWKKMLLVYNILVLVM